MTNYAKMLLENRGFAGEKINAKSLPQTEVKAWHAALDKLHSVAYDVASERYNVIGDNNGMIVSRFYAVLQGVYALVGELDNGAVLRCDANACNAVVAMATRIGIKKSGSVQYAEGKKRNAAKRLAELEAMNGANPEAIEKLRSEIAEAEAEITELKGQSMNVYKSVMKCSASTFYKAFEDFIADMALTRSIMTEAEVQAEKKALKEARKARRANKK